MQAPGMSDKEHEGYAQARQTATTNCSSTDVIDEAMVEITREVLNRLREAKIMKTESARSKQQ